MLAMEMGKRLFQLSLKQLQRGKKTSQRHECYTFELPLMKLNKIDLTRKLLG